MKTILIISLLFISLFVTSCGKKADNTETLNNNENIISQNTNPNVVKKQEIEGLLYDNENKELFSFNNYIGDYIESKSKLKLSSNIEGDLTTIYSVKYEVIK